MQHTAWHGRPGGKGTFELAFAPDGRRLILGCGSGNAEALRLDLD